MLEVLVLAIPTVLLAGCPALDPPPQYGQNQGYDYPPEQDPQGGNPPQPGYPAIRGYPRPRGYPPQPAYPPPQGDSVPPPQSYGYPPQQGPWVPPSPAQPPMAQPQPQGSGPLPWWPQGIPNPGALGIPGMPAVIPAMPGGPAQQCVDAVNKHRQTQGLTPVVRWLAAEPCVAGQAQSDGQAGQAHGSFGRCGEAAQNVCPGWRGPAEQMTGPCLQSMWNEGPGADFSAHGHYLNMSNPRYTRVACGYFTTPQGRSVGPPRLPVTRVAAAAVPARLLDLARGPRSPRRVSETAARRRLTITDLWAIPRVGTPAPAPDGSFVVVGVTTYAADGDEGKERLYLVPTAGEGEGRTPRPLTAPDVSSGQPSVSPDGRRLAFVRKPPGGGPAQLHVMPLDGGELAQAAHRSRSASPIRAGSPTGAR